jgi:hypothetical protein
MNTPAQPLDVVTLATVMVTVLLGPEAARVLGPYVVIFCGALLGSGISAGRRDTETWAQTLKHMALWIGLALFISVPMAMLVAQQWGVEMKWVLGPVAVAVAGIGHDWPRVGTFLVGVAARGIEAVASRRFGGGADNNGGSP